MDRYYSDALPSTSGISLNLEVDANDDYNPYNISRSNVPTHVDRKGYLHLDENDESDEYSDKFVVRNEATYDGVRIDHSSLALNYTCKTCGDKFDNKPAFKAHKKEHKLTKCAYTGGDNSQGQSLYRCQICSKGFSHQANIKIHMRVHNKERPFHCTQCGKSFSQLGNLQTHMNIHEEFKPFACDVCLRSFTQAGNAKKHRETRHVAPTLQCSVCHESFTSTTKLSIHAASHRLQGLTDETSHLARVSGKKNKSRSTVGNCERADTKHPSQSSLIASNSSSLSPNYSSQSDNKDILSEGQQDQLLNVPSHCNFFHENALKIKPFLSYGDINRVSSDHSNKSPIMLVPNFMYTH